MGSQQISQDLGTGIHRLQRMLLQTSMDRSQANNSDVSDKVKPCMVSVHTHCGMS